MIKNGGAGSAPSLFMVNSKLCLIIVACLSIAVSACSSTLHHSGRSESAFVINDIPFFPQEEYQCGPSAMATVLNFHGISVSPAEIAAEIYSYSARGTLDFDLVIYAERKGMRASQYSGSIADLKKTVAENIPVIVLIDNGFSVYRIYHYMVVTGFDAYGIIVNSGSERQKYINDKKFLHSWEKTDFWTLVLRTGA